MDQFLGSTPSREPSPGRFGSHLRRFFQVFSTFSVIYAILAFHTNSNTAAVSLSLAQRAINKIALGVLTNNGNLVTLLNTTESLSFESLSFESLSSSVVCVYSRGDGNMVFRKFDLAGCARIKPSSVAACALCLVVLFGMSSNKVHAQGGPGGGGVALESHCVVITAGDPQRVGSCVGATGCISRAGFIGPVWAPTPYLSAQNFVEHWYNDCKMLPIVDGDCWAGWGSSKVCLTFDAYASVGPLGTPLCTAGAMVGTVEIEVVQCW
jgi:hypothetical protein